MPFRLRQLLRTICGRGYSGNGALVSTCCAQSVMMGAVFICQAEEEKLQIPSTKHQRNFKHQAPCLNWEHAGATEKVAQVCKLCIPKTFGFGRRFVIGAFRSVLACGKFRAVSRIQFCDTAGCKRALRPRRATETNVLDHITSSYPGPAPVRGQCIDPRLGRGSE